MNKYLLGMGITMSLFLSACSRSPDSQFYVLNPISQQQNKLKNYSHLRIGINEIHCPAYMSKEEVMVHYSKQEVKLEDFHRWVTNLKKNTQSVIEANLATLLPGVAFESAPWGINFKPRIQLQIDILQFDVDIQGNSNLRADYLIYEEGKLTKQGRLVFHKKVLNTKVENLVASMNENLNQFSRDLAKVLSRISSS